MSIIESKGDFKADGENWYFSEEEMNDSPSRKFGIDARKELLFRHQGARLIQDLGERLKVPQMLINTAIVYMHRFYMLHSFTQFDYDKIGEAALLLAAKVEDDPKKIEHLVQVNNCMHEGTFLDKKSENFREKCKEIETYKNILLGTLELTPEEPIHPHVYLEKCLELIDAKDDIRRTSYFMATNSLHLTTMSLQYKPALVACACVHFVCKWNNLEIRKIKEGKEWFEHVDPSITLEMIETLTSEYLAILDKYPNRLKKINSGNQAVPSSSNGMRISNNNENKSPVGISNAMKSNARPPQVSVPSNTAKRPKIGKIRIVNILSNPRVISTVDPDPNKRVHTCEENLEERDVDRERVKNEMRDMNHPPILTPTVSSSHCPEVDIIDSISPSSYAKWRLIPITIEPPKPTASEIRRSLGIRTYIGEVLPCKESIIKTNVIASDKSIKNGITGDPMLKNNHNSSLLSSNRKDRIPSSKCLETTIPKAKDIQARRDQRLSKENENPQKQRGSRKRHRESSPPHPTKFPRISCSNNASLVDKKPLSTHSVPPKVKIVNSILPSTYTKWRLIPITIEPTVPTASEIRRSLGIRTDMGEDPTCKESIIKTNIKSSNKKHQTWHYR